jgi:uncharacterized membrane protein
MKALEKYPLIGLTFVIFVAAFLRIYHIDRPSFFGDYDEYYTAKTAWGVYEEKISNETFVNLQELHSHSTWQNIQDANRDNGNSFAYNLLLHYWCSIFGKTEIALRLFSVLFDLISIGLIFLIGRKLKIPSTRILLACALFAVFPVFTMFGGIIRTYAFTTAMCLWLAYALIDLKENGTKFKTILIIGSIGTLAFLGHFLTYYILGITFVVFFFLRKKIGTYAIHVMLGLTLTGVLCGGFLAYNIVGLRNINQKSEEYRNGTIADRNTRNLESITVGNVAVRTVTYLDQFYTGNQRLLLLTKNVAGEKVQLLGGVLILLAPFLLLFFMQVNEEQKTWYWLGMALLIGGHVSVIALTFISGHMVPLGIKYTMFTIPWFFMLAAFFSKKNILVIGSFALILLGSVYSTFGALDRRGMKAIPVSAENISGETMSFDAENLRAKVGSLLSAQTSDTLFVDNKYTLVFIETQNIEHNHKTAYLLENDSLQQFASRVMPLHYSLPE